MRSVGSLSESFYHEGRALLFRLQLITCLFRVQFGPVADEIVMFFAACHHGFCVSRDRVRSDASLKLCETHLVFGRLCLELLSELKDHDTQFSVYEREIRVRSESERRLSAVLSIVVRADVTGLFIETQNKADVHLRLKAFILQGLHGIKACDYRTLVVRCASSVYKAVSFVYHLERICRPVCSYRHDIQMSYYTEVLIAAVLRLPFDVSGVVFIIVDIKAFFPADLQHAFKSLLHALSKRINFSVRSLHRLCVHARLGYYLSQRLKHVVFVCVYPFKITHFLLLSRCCFLLPPGSRCPR